MQNFYRSVNTRRSLLLLCG